MPAQTRLKATLQRFPYLLDFSMFALLFATSFYSHFSVELLGVTVRPAYVVSLAFLVIALLTRRLHGIELTRSSMYMGLWLGVNLFASLRNAPLLSESLKSLALLALGALTCWLIARLGKRFGDRVAQLYIRLGQLAVLLSIIGTLADAALGTAFFSHPPNSGVPFRRGFGLFFEPNYFGIVSMMLCIVLFYDWLSPKRLETTRVPWQTLLCLVGVVLAGTRSAQITLVLGLVIVVYMRRQVIFNNRLRVRILLAIILLFAAFMTLAATGVIHSANVDRLLESFDTSSVASLSVTGRFGLVHQALNDLRTSPWLGHGTNAYTQRHVLLDASGEPIYGKYGNYLMLMPFAIVFDAGIIGGLIALVWLIVHHLAAWQASRLHAASNLLKPLILASVLMLICFVTSYGIYLAFPWVHLGIVEMLTLAAEDKAAIARANNRTP